MEGRGRRQKETHQPGLSLCHKLAGLPASKCSKLQIWMTAKLCHLLCRDEPGGTTLPIPCSLALRKSFKGDDTYIGNSVSSSPHICLYISITWSLTISELSIVHSWWWMCIFNRSGLTLELEHSSWILQMVYAICIGFTNDPFRNREHVYQKCLPILHKQASKYILKV